eukprot:TRINITY_DN10263_c0_g3_i1.p1 TRINITY_DN10263_c0_g3~~TRINITY_DN10263_c0_g3_i1.p1  ORF type:complete len:581 (+),score=87.55 TRINITY_DN10263_c0_g3_i1:1-1743(+)
MAACLRFLQTSSIKLLSFPTLLTTRAMTSRHSAKLIGAIDQGTSSSRFMIYSEEGQLIASHQVETTSSHPHQGWVEQDPKHILSSVRECIDAAVAKLPSQQYSAQDIAAVGITNQRESTIAWDSSTGEPLHNAIIWLDTRTSDLVDDLIERTPSQQADFFQRDCGLPLSNYFSAVKMKWMIDNVPKVADKLVQGRCLFGTVDSWLMYNLTGGADGGVHVTDVTNASRTMLMDIETRQWSPKMLDFFGIPAQSLPRIASSAEVYGRVRSGVLRGVPIASCLGDQQAALVGQRCLTPGMAKNTYGTGCFLLYNTGNKPNFSRHGLLTTVGFQLGPEAPCFYALEGAVAVAGQGVRWLRDNLDIIDKAADVETLAASVPSDGVYFVPAFSGLLAPEWRQDARGTIVGLNHSSTKAHIARAMLEAVCFQTRQLVEAMAKDSGSVLQQLHVDGGMTANKLMMQMQADLLGVDVVRPANAESTSWGAALAAGTAVGEWQWERIAQAATAQRWSPTSTSDSRDAAYVQWKRAIKRSLGWIQSENTRVSPSPSPTVSRDPVDYEARKATAWSLVFYLLLVGTTQLCWP